MEEIVEEKLNEASMDWEDGTELEIYGDLPPYQGEGGIVISDITIKKYHCTDTWNGQKQKYKYVLEIDGNVKIISYAEDENGVFHAIVEQYNIYGDYDVCFEKEELDAY